MKGRGDAESMPYFPTMECHGGRGHKVDSAPSGLGRRISSMFRNSALASACSFTVRNVSDAVQEPVYLSSRRLNTNCRILQRAPSLHSFSVSTAIPSGCNVTVDQPRQSVLLPGRGRNHSSGAVPDAIPCARHAGELSDCQSLRHSYNGATARREDKKTGVEVGRRRVPRPAMLLRPSGRAPKFLNGKKHPTSGTDVFGNYFPSDKMKKGQPSSPVVAATSTTSKKKTEKGKAPGGLWLSHDPYDFTSSSFGESDAGGWGSWDALFSSDDEYGEQEGAVCRHRREDETETLFSSSRSFSSTSTAEFDYYCRSSRSNRSSRRRKKSLHLLPGGKYSTPRGEVAIWSGCNSHAGSMRFDFDDGFGSLVPISSGNAKTTRRTTEAASSSLSSSPLPENKELLVREDHADVEKVSSTQTRQPAPPSQGEQVERDENQAMMAPSRSNGTVMEELRADKPVDGGYAVVKESSDPYSDFRSSALEMIMERQLFGPRELECLLHAFLSLNQPHDHPVILDVFTEIWEAISVNS